MANLELLKSGASVRRLVAGAAQIVQVERFVGQAVRITFDEPGGMVKNGLLYRTDEPSLEVVEAGRARSSAGDGELFRLVSEAQSIQILVARV